MEKDDLLFDVVTPLGFRVLTTRSYWEYITTIKHPSIKGLKSDVIATLENPDLIRQSRVDKDVYLLYKDIIYNNKNYHMCVVTNKIKEMVITIYITDRIKEGIQIWERSE